MKQTILHLIGHLRDNAREKLTCISKKTSIPISTLFDGLKELKGITKSTILLDFVKFGYETRAHIFLQVPQAQKESIQKHLLCHHHVNNMYKLHGEWDFEIETVHTTLRDLDKFLETLNSKFEITNREVHHIVCDLKREAFLSRSSQKLYKQLPNSSLNGYQNRNKAAKNKA